MKKKVEDWLTQTRACRPRKGSFSSAGSCRLAWSVPGCTVPPVCSWNGPEEDDAASVVWPQTECGMDTHKMRHGHIQVWTHTKCVMAIYRCGHRQIVVWTRTQCGVAIDTVWWGHWRKEVWPYTESGVDMTQTHVHPGESVIIFYESTQIRKTHVVLFTPFV